MIFDRNRRARSNLERELRAQSPEPPGALVEEIVGRVADAERRPRHTGSRLRLGVGFALTAVLLVAMAAFGGIGYAQTAVLDTTSAAVDTVKRAVTSKPTQTTSSSPSPSNNFAAALATYPGLVLTCDIVFAGSGNGRKLKVEGTTTVAQGTITVSVSETPDTTNFPFNDSFPATLTWSSGNSGKVTVGNSYTATVTQTIAGFDPTTCVVTETG